MVTTPLWQVAECELQATGSPPDPVRVDLRYRFTSPSGATRHGYGFWDGDQTWRVRFAPDELGMWTGETWTVGTSHDGLSGQRIELRAIDPIGDSPFRRHGPLRVSEAGRQFCHADGTPFLWLADTAWNGPLRSGDEEWAAYLEVRTRQGLTAVQWVATQWLAAPDGDRDGRQAYSVDGDRISLDPAFFRRLDGKVRSVADAGLLSVPVLLWAAHWSTDHMVNALNPGLTLGEDEATLLARHMVARWDAYPVAWLLPGDASYVGDRAGRWHRIGEAVFGDVDHAPVSLHPNGVSWYGDEFDSACWLDFIGYQSGHGDSDEATGWLTEGPPATGWQGLSPRPIVNLEPAYEGHVAYDSKWPFTAAEVRKRLAWSLLVSPTAGVTYGCHGVWGWDDGTTEPTNHPGSGVPPHWRHALRSSGAEQLTHLRSFLEEVEWWRLHPAPELVLEQPGGQRFIAAAAAPEGDLVVAYVPQDRQFRLDDAALRHDLEGRWISPVDGSRHQAMHHEGRFVTPADGDWWLCLQVGRD